MRMCGICKTGSLGVLAYRRGHRSRRYRRLWPLFAKVPAYSFNDAGQLQRRVVFGFKPKLLIPYQSAHVYFM
jgi:hypothetical protein